MKTYLYILLISAIFFIPKNVYSQGCVAIRGSSSTSIGTAGGYSLKKGEVMVGTNFRYFKSFRHFRGTTEETQRVIDGTEVINHSYFVDAIVNYGITKRMFGTLIVPYVHHTRSSMYEHGGNPPKGLGERHITSSQGLSDIRIGGGYWIMDPEKENPYNFSVGLGLKLPTGRYDYKDTFYNQGPNKDIDTLAVVDQSIQLGDGGTGVTLDFQGFYSISKRMTLNSTLYYMINSRETNGVLTRNGKEEFSCPDQFAARLGMIYMTRLKGVNTFMGGRLEGVPSSDLIGGSAGYRRPGYVLSFEPAVYYNTEKFGLNISVPMAIIRNRVQSYDDKVKTATTGVYTQGDAAFANYTINLALTYRFGSEKSDKQPKNIQNWNKNKKVI